MLLLSTLSTKPEADPGLDQAQLFALGMESIRAYSRRIWTDHNTHDPGITTHELACYALTELTYRALFPIEDLLADDDGGKGMAAQFYTARQVLPNRALTVPDFRKLLLDLPGIQDAWIAPEPLTYYADLGAAALRFDDPGGPTIRPVSVRGLYRALVAFEDDVTTPDAQDALRAEALEALRRNRSLCEDFVAVDAVNDQWFALCGELDLAPGADAAAVAARVIFDVGRYLAPRVRRYSLDEMLSGTDADGNPYTADAVFNGPAPGHGFIDTAELLAAALRTEIRLTDVFAVVMDVAGVVAVRDLVVNALAPFDLRLMAWGDGNGVPASGTGLVIVGTDDNDLLHIRVFDAGGNMVTDADETKLTAQAGAIAALKPQIPGLLPPHVLTDAEKTRLLGAVATIVGASPPVQAAPDDGPYRAPVEPADKWRVPVDAGSRPRLSRAHGRLVLYQGGIPVEPAATAVDAQLKTLNDAAHQAARPTAGADLPIPPGRPRASASYRSVQYEFPALYGLSAEGLPPGADSARRVAVLQFQGYLLFFDQVMANFCAQLANLRTLFTRDDTTGPTYASQVVAGLPGFPDFKKIYPEAANDAELASKLAPLFETDDQALRRRDRFLDHLLARVASDFREYVGIMAAAFGGSVAGSVATKSAFLRAFPEQAARRGQGYDVLGSGSDSLNVSGVERRLASLLGLRAPRTLVQPRGAGGFGFTIDHPADGLALLVAPAPLATEADARAAMHQALARGRDATAYDRSVTAEGKHTFQVVDAAHEPLAGPSSPFDTTEETEAAITRLIADLQDLGSGEAIALVEMILLRPRPRDPAHPEDDEPFPTICVDPNCTDCGDDDPYSYQVQVVLTADAGRFKNMDFRRFVEGVIRREMPAHVMPRVCWADSAHWAAFRDAHDAWKALPATAPAAVHKAAVAALLAALQAVRNVYPEQKLHGCDAGPASPPFVLGRSALGTDRTLNT